MKIGIVTIMDYTNYGNRLQNYAVYYVLGNKLGHEVYSLETHSENKFHDGNYISWFKEKIAMSLCCFPDFAEKKFGNNITRWTNFYNWSKLIHTIKYYNSNDLPISINDEFDCFFVGSDQVWNYNFKATNFNNYFLKFADNSKKNSISASFGISDIPEEWKKTYIDGLSDFSHISVREDAGKRIVNELVDKDATVLIDPTMMLNKEEWLKVSKKPRVDCNKPYVLKYYLGDKEESYKVDKWAKDNGYEVYELLNDSIPELYSAGPGEFISLINNASLVCSDSFHCIVFSIIFSKPFIVFSRKGANSNMISRLETLLSKFGFEERWSNKLEQNEYLTCDFKHAHEVLKQEQVKFINFINEAIS